MNITVTAPSGIGCCCFVVCFVRFVLVAHTKNGMFECDVSHRRRLMESSGCL